MSAQIYYGACLLPCATIAKKEVRMKKAGFSLIELMIALCMVCCVIVFTFTNVTFLNRILMRCELDKLHAAALYASRCAQVTNQECVLAFDVTNNSYSTQHHKEALAKGVAFGFLPNAKGPPSAPHNPIKSPITYKNKKITFYPSGIMDAGTVYLVDEHKTMMYALSSPISQFSFVRKYRYDKTWVQI